jgi:hypothetical protein
MPAAIPKNQIAGLLRTEQLASQNVTRYARPEFIDSTTQDMGVQTGKRVAQDCLCDLGDFTRFK